MTLADGFEKHLFVDQQTLLVIGDRRAAPVHAFGAAVRSENRIGDYRRVKGVLFPFLVVETEIPTGKELNRFTTQSIEVNTKLDPSFFAPPQYSRTAFQQFFEQLYMERTQFRSSHPDVDTREGVEFIATVYLLRANAVDYPRSASAQYGLGRAYRAAGDVVNAKFAFQRVLRIDPSFQKATDRLNALR